MANTTTKTVTGTKTPTSKDDSIGALWKRTTKESGKKYLYGKITVGKETIEFTVWPNMFKVVGDNRPDFRLRPFLNISNKAPKTSSEVVPSEAVESTEDSDLI